MKIKDIQKSLVQAGLQHRDTQLEMIQAIYNAITQRKILCVEAPTGTGKTISYCIGSHLAKSKKQIIIVSTSTIALQEQLVYKDLPLLSKILGKKIHFTLAKGRRRYVCHRKLFSSDGQKEFFEDNAELDKLQSMLSNNHWNGDRDELDIHISDPQWRTISTDAAGCIGKLCEFYEDCAFFSARKKIHQAEIIVVNHSLLLSDLELGGGVILPDPDKSIYIIDECHHLPSKALDHFAKSDAIMGSVDWINSLTKTLTMAIKAKQITESVQKHVNALTHDLIQVLSSMRDIINLNENKFHEKIWRIKEIPQEIQEIAKIIASLACRTMQQCELVYESLEDRIKESSLTIEDKSAIEKIISSLGFAAGRAKNLYETWNLFCHQREANEAPIARWFEKRGEAYFCHASPINVSKKLKESLWDKAKNGVVLCSATIRALGKFDDFRRKTGLHDIPDYVENAVASCFDYKKSVLYLPSMQHEPAGLNQDAHRKEAIDLLPKLILSTAGTLVLFTSRSAMETTYEAMPDAYAKDILMQKQHNKNKLIQMHKKRIRLGKRSIIFGLTSFGEGLDLPADFCQHVIIHKLPFAVPSTPIELTRNEWLKSNRLNPFMLSSLPRASIRLTQYVGRLIRQESDIGVVSILDKRIYSKQYGSFLLENLPDFQQLIDKDIDCLKSTASIAHLWE